MKYCSPRAIEPRIPSYTHTQIPHTQSHTSQNSKTDVFLNSAAISNATLKKRDYRDRQFKPASNFNFQPANNRQTGFLQTPELKLCRNIRSALGELFEIEKRRLLNDASGGKG